MPTVAALKTVVSMTSACGWVPMSGGRQRVAALQMDDDLKNSTHCGQHTAARQLPLPCVYFAPFLPPPPCFVAVTAGSFRYSGRRFRWLAPGVRASGCTGLQTCWMASPQTGNLCLTHARAHPQRAL